MSKIKAPKGAPFARILGVGGYRPVRVVPNEVILETIDSSDEWIRSRSGIETRHWANDEETVAAMSIEASGKAIADAGINADQIGAVVVSTVSHFSQTPAVATEIADKLGTNKAAAFDISAGCAGFGYGLTLAKGMVVEGSAEYVLVIGVERLSDLTDLEDRATAFLFGDGAGAVVVGPRTSRTSARPCGAARATRPARSSRPSPGTSSGTVTSPPFRSTPRARSSSLRSRRRARRCSAGPCSRWRRSPSRRWTRPESPRTTWMSSFPTRPTSGSSTRW